MIGQLRTHDRSSMLSEASAKVARCALACLLSLALALMPNSAFALEGALSDNVQNKSTQTDDPITTSDDAVILPEPEDSEKLAVATVDSSQESSASEISISTADIVPADDIAVSNMVNALVATCNQANPGASDTMKALWFHNYLVDHVTYDYNAQYVGAQGVLIDQRGDSEAFYLAYSMLLNAVGIQTHRVDAIPQDGLDNYSGRPFVWTGALLDGKWYHISTAADRKAYQEYGAKFDGNANPQWNKYIYFAVPSYVMQAAFPSWDGCYVEPDGSRVYFYGTDYYDKSMFLERGHATRLASPYFNDTSGTYSVKHLFNNGKKEFNLPLSLDFTDKETVKLEPEIDNNSAIYDMVAYCMREQSYSNGNYAWNGRRFEVVFRPGGFNNNTGKKDDPVLSFQASLRGVRIDGVPDSVEENGMPITFSNIKVYYGTSILLTEGVDYRVEYSNNRSVGTAEIEILPIIPTSEGQEVFAQSEIKTFRITPKPQGPEKTLDEAFDDVLYDLSKKEELETEYDKAVYLHGQVIDNCKYDTSDTLIEPEDALIRGCANSEGMSEALAKLYSRIDIEAETVQCDGWTWVRAKLDGVWCNIDPGFDNVLWEDSDQTAKSEDWVYRRTLSFGLTDDQIRIIHPNFEPEPGYEANDDSTNYFMREDSRFEAAKAVTNIKKQIADGFNQGLLEFTVDLPKKLDEVVYQIIYTKIAEKLNDTPISGVKAKVKYNNDKSTYTVYWGDKIALKAEHATVKDVTYSGFAVAPEVSVSVKGVTLTKGVDYTVSNPTRVDAGTGSITITGTGTTDGPGLYVGSFVVNYQVNRRSIAEAGITVSTAMTYTGSQLKPVPILKHNGKTLVQGKDYNVSYGTNVSGKSGTLTITGINNFTQSIAKSFAINPAAITSATVTGISDQLYSPSGRAPVPTVKWGSITLKSGTDYTVSYANNVAPGQATVTIKGAGNMTGTITKTFNIYTSSTNRPDVTGAWKTTNGKYWFSYDAKTKAAQRNKSFPANEWVRVGSNVYHFDTAGYMHYGWVQMGSVWYYFGANNDGALKYGWQKIGGKWYYFNTSSGAMLSGWQTISGAKYYFNSSGVMLTGWQLIGNVWYYFDTYGAMMTGWQKIGTTWYYFNSSGAMLTGWQNIGTDRYYFNGSGAMLTGWQTIGGKDYYFESWGAMARNKWIGKYHVNADGVWDQTR